MELPSDKNISCFYDSSTDCVKVLDANATMLSFNPKGYELMEIDTPSSVLGSNWLKMWKGGVAPKAELAFDQALQGKTGQFEGYCPTMKGTPRWWRVSVVPLKNEYGEVQWVLVTSRDLTEVVRLREENEALRKRLASVARSRVDLARQ